MQARAAAAVVATNAASDSVLEALARHAANIHATATRSVKLNEKRLDGAAFNALCAACPSSAAHAISCLALVSASSAAHELSP